MKFPTVITIDQGTDLTLIHVAGTLVAVRHGDETGQMTEEAVLRELLVSGDSRVHLACSDADVHVHLLKRADQLHLLGSQVVDRTHHPCWPREQEQSWKLATSGFNQCNLE